MSQSLGSFKKKLQLSLVAIAIVPLLFVCLICSLYGTPSASETFSERHGFVAEGDDAGTTHASLGRDSNRDPDARRAGLWRLALLGASVALAAALGALVMAGRLADPIVALSHAVEAVRAGDLSVEIPEQEADEREILAEGIRAIVRILRRFVSDSDGTAQRIASVQDEILKSCDQQVCGAREQSTAVSHTTAAAAELSHTSEQIGETIETVSLMASHVLRGMEKIQVTTNQTNKILTSLNEKSKQIGNITELIDDVADQTNLLAVNASIEAARAGEQGRGFTVVADQIGKLADSTAKSTKDITSLVEMIQHEMSNAIVAMEQSSVSVEEEILRAKDSASKSKEIAMSATQQISGSRQIAESMAGIDETMKQIVSGAQQSASVASRLSGLADELKGSMTGFRFVSDPSEGQASGHRG